MDRLTRLDREIEGLKAIVAELRNKVAMLERAQGMHRHPVESILWQRGLPVLATGDRSQSILPPNASPVQISRFYQLMRRYSFRLFLRDLIQYPEGNDLKVLTRYCSLGTVKGYMKFLSETGIVENSSGNGYGLVRRQFASFGPTLEWYVNEIFQREFLAPSLFNIRLGNTRHGGDYDVITILTGYLVYVEVKSSPPRGVEQPAVTAFMKRLEDLQPDMAVFLVDTELRMKDKIVPMFEEALAEEGFTTEEWGVRRLVDEIFHIGRSIYLINSRKGIYSNLRVCVRDCVHRGNKVAESQIP
jgi:hypothetical protein